MNRTIAVGMIILTLCAPAFAVPSPTLRITAKSLTGHQNTVVNAVPRARLTQPKPMRASVPAAATPPVFRPIVRFQNLWNSNQHAFHIRVEDSDKRVFLFKITDPNEYAEVQTILSSAGGAQTDGESISANPQASAAVAPE